MEKEEEEEEDTFEYKQIWGGWYGTGGPWRLGRRPGPALEAATVLLSRGAAVSHRQVGRAANNSSIYKVLTRWNKKFEKSCLLGSP